MKVDIRELKAFRDKLQRFKDGQADRNNRFLDLEAEGIIEEAKSNTPVLTGFLKGAYVSEPAQNAEKTIENPAEYASFIEFGHRSYEGRYMLTAAANNAAQAREKNYQAFLEKKFEDA